MSNSVTQHRQAASTSIRCAVLTVSDTRTLQTDKGGQLVVDQLSAAGHNVVAREIAPDEPDPVGTMVGSWIEDDAVDAVLITGGTGIAPRDQTCETVSALFSKPIPGYGELFRMLSYEEIGAAAMLSRAVGGLGTNSTGRATIVLTMPGSTAAVRLAMEKLILPELCHLVNEANKTV